MMVTIESILAYWRDSTYMTDFMHNPYYSELFYWIIIAALVYRVMTAVGDEAVK